MHNLIIQSLKIPIKINDKYVINIRIEFYFYDDSLFNLNKNNYNKYFNKYYNLEKYYFLLILFMKNFFNN